MLLHHTPLQSLRLLLIHSVAPLHQVIASDLTVSGFVILAAFNQVKIQQPLPAAVF